MEEDRVDVEYEAVERAREADNYELRRAEW